MREQRPLAERWTLLVVDRPGFGAASRVSSVRSESRGRPRSRWTLAAAAFPKLVVSGAHHPAFDAVCDVLERRLGAERAVIPGAGHGVQRTGAPFSEPLEGFLRSAAAAAD